MSEKNDATRGADGQSGQGHALDDKVRQRGQQHTVLEGSWLAFVGIADDVLGVRRLGSDQFPLAAGGKPGSTHASQPGVVEL